MGVCIVLSLSRKETLQDFISKLCRNDYVDNVFAEQKLRSLGATYEYQTGKWIIPRIAEDLAEKIILEYWDNLITIETTITKSNISKCANYTAVQIAGYIIARVSGRDSGAKISKGVSVIEGGFASDGSSKNYYCRLKDSQARIRFQIAASKIDEIKNINDSDFKIIDTRGFFDKKIENAIELLKDNGYFVVKAIDLDSVIAETINTTNY
jgi:hypothetical protein